MNFVELLFTFAVAMLFFLAIDLLWLGVLAKDFYKKHLKTKMRKVPNWPVAFLFYAVFIIGLIYFAIRPAIVDEDFVLGILNGFLYGIFTYSTYELTNLAVIKGWPRGVVLIDILWGGILSFSVVMLTYLCYFLI